MRLRRAPLASEGGAEGGGAAPGKRARTEAVARARGGGGAPLDGGVRAQFEGSLGVDLGGVRVHTGAASAEAADAVSAKAYTVGQDIHFGAGQYAPEDPYGLHLLAHEVAHTVQQDGGAPEAQFKLEISAPGDACEVEADCAADAMVAGHWFHIGTSAGGLMRKTVEEPPRDEPAKPPSEAEKQRYREDKGFAEGLMHKAEALQGEMLKHHDQEMDAIGAIAASGGVLVEKYDQAYAVHERVIKEADEAEDTRQGILDFVLNVVVGAATGGLGAVFAPTASAAFSLGRALTEELISQTVSTVASATVLDIKTTLSAVAKENKDAERWHMVAELFREAADLVPTLGKLAQFTQSSTKVVGDANALASGAPLAFFASRYELDNAIRALRAAGLDAELAQMRAAIKQGWRVLFNKWMDIERAARRTSVEDLERKIWLDWIAQLPADGVGRSAEYDQLDNDVIERHLVRLGVTAELKHDRGLVTHAEDERIMQASAEEKVEILRYQGMIGRVHHSNGAWLLVAPDWRSIRCTEPPDEFRGGWFKVWGPVSHDDYTYGEKRVRWVASLQPIREDEVLDNGIDPDWNEPLPATPRERPTSSYGPPCPPHH